MDFKLDDLLKFEARTLGNLHSKKIMYVDEKEIENEVDLFAKFFQDKFDHLKN